ncbi:FAD-binding oxidoreductase [Chitinasiproducens palmae]|uniref:FAD/FMN-containing dehydrogenase n=1 Tax=Chitinasiproducens palmae TaxID=1770053 RepID=A0A1H2PS57_9BURK|nr:FAD-binding oxidoreductase [Chitinasiproducens palmae]SDV48977.1 FAD/FMN-containing dehydrogenase [Chitinasiproducens palmae]
MNLLESLLEVVGPKGLVGADDAEPLLTDWRGRYHGAARAIVRPADTAQLAGVMKLCAAHGISVVPQGGNTGLVGGATPSEAGDAILLSLARMVRVREVDTRNDTITVEAGCTLQQIQTLAASVDRLFPLSLASEGSCQIGGNISTNAGGTAVLRYGNMRALVLGLEVVLPDGRIWDGLRGLRKDNTGYDMKQLFIGAEGTLGVVTAAVLKLFPALRSRATAWVALASADAAIDLLARCRAACGDALTSFELMSRSQLDIVYQQVADTRDPLDGTSPWALLIELADSSHDAPLQAMLEDVIGAALEDGTALDAALPANETQAAALWHIRHIVSEANVRFGTSVTHDISLPISQIPGCLAQTERRLSEAGLIEGAQCLYVGHVGDGNIHSIVIFPHHVWARVEDRDARAAKIGTIVNDTAVQFGGSISAEHGIGQAHRGELEHYKSDVELDIMRAVKHALDPDRRMNPGKLL